MTQTLATLSGLRMCQSELRAEWDHRTRDLEVMYAGLFWQAITSAGSKVWVSQE